MRYFIQLAYKGTRYCGWQIQPNQPSVQAEIEQALTRLNSQQLLEITGCGRTDTGVHALDYYAHFDHDEAIDCQQWSYKLNLMLPTDIAIYRIIKVDDQLHARFSAVARTYHYEIHTHKNPFLTDTSLLNSHPLNLELIESACKLIKAHTDFECFSKVHTDVSNFNCDIHHIEWCQTVAGYRFSVTANRFLRNMVRAMVGTLLDVGQEKISLEELKIILNSKNRSLAGTSVPAQGLSLVKVDYPHGSF